jgi:2-dehydropantoate 2-reductase
MHIAIFGAGSVGAYVGGMLTRAGENVTLVDAWPEHVERMKQDGLRVTGTQGDWTVPVRALHLHEIHALSRRPVDVAILGVKSYDTTWMTTLIAQYLAPGGYVLSMQNGMNEETIAHVVGWGRVVGCVLNTIGVEMTGPGATMRWMAPAPAGYAVFRIGEVHGRVTPRIEAIARALQAVDNATCTSNLWGERWSKLVNNATASGIGPLTGLGILDMLRNRDTRRLSIRVGQEGVRVGKALGLHMEKVSGIAPEVWLEGDAQRPEGFERIEAGLRDWETRIGKEGQPSTLHDVRRGRRTEIASINGLIADKAAEAGTTAPLNAELTALVGRLEAGEIGQGLATVAHLFDGR